MTGGGEEEGADGRPGRLPQTLHKETRLRPLINSFDRQLACWNKGTREQGSKGEVGKLDSALGKRENPVEQKRVHRSWNHYGERTKGSYVGSL